MNRTLKMFAALAPLVAFAPVAAQSNNAPVVAVLVFDNNSYGFAGAKDFDGVGKAISEIMIVDLAATTKVRVVDRSRVQAILEEQKLTKEGAVDAQTAIRIGRILGACYSIYGGFTRDMQGMNYLTIHTTNNETSQIGNAVKGKPSKTDDITSLINEASAKFIDDLKVDACPGTAGTRRSGDASPAAQQQASAPVTQQQASAPAGASTAAPKQENVQLYAKPLSQAEIKKVQSNKLDARTMLIYSRALDAKDRKDNARARQLAQQVVDKFPGFSPAQELIKAASAGN
jgi:hypothetical protein